MSFDTTTPLPGWQHAYSGKVRDLYTPDDADPVLGADRMLVVASDRVSAYDAVLEPGIPGKGELLTTLSLWWFAQLSDVPNHLVPGEIPEEVRGRAMLVKTLDMVPIECVVRGYLSGSGWKEYRATGSVCGVPLPEGLQDGDPLPEPIYTPAWKAPQGEHDENITFERTVEIVGEAVAEALRTLSLAVFREASAIALARGVLLADTKFEFGVDRESGVVTLGDEVLTSDSSRYWDADDYDAGIRGRSFDKQIVRDWLADNWDGQGLAPTLPSEIVERTAARYRELIERLTR
ncbi:phosphoribosylaminoimidazolesuccinocarboxamide synthase [Rathayibacter rathayi]|uniref:Phosphoribosylaminoimidazole-succinocarboxamide synthase n=1 Tax=Rathayibacter rathayi TaxID=33887 RepID=A0ABD6W4T0_RATRA|nr:phosphoribosylaminoimidazolesuccinocarboxamide synthase [Rathayibacter rathayi]AZZ50558.1 phosphoribosylaminoimidazolesuccinocarboxamide synthase [Rathayibacter rathayi]MWV75962.1 phosphoribosylaminoimidazolesuccinocarboxamide synthase [Rathayibacter rathayi NCPPB 2980 = VKM Ac-1601]PPF09725.1 phosphoribosylaminoimidazolesuccinocarboxamide synthase [Rathayibacter rathayi]PPF18591.1 phosphoribosylaminoimidazolesuccinocarboxamide synthase [Rathayibacter rathayi]PPF41894.1 phosphoribosylaminoi